MNSSVVFLLVVLAAVAQAKPQFLSYAPAAYAAAPAYSYSYAPSVAYTAPVAAYAPAVAAAPYVRSAYTYY
ncbi:cuticle protein 16.5-like [Thrips palmi]|uniref:Cuticle protein 16.5-like n=1 Tax=Thrips palmi TaxID=161013 RepID=A0A6P9AMJ6_THRPL|nr:cuticle protein 16.5-like [Thrips palmi]